MEKVPVSPIAGTPHPGFFVCCEHAGTRFTADVSRGEIPDVPDTNSHPILICRWQLLFSNSLGAGLCGSPFTSAYSFPACPRVSAKTTEFPPDLSGKQSSCALTQNMRYGTIFM